LITLTALLAGLVQPQAILTDGVVSGLCSDSRRCQPGDLYLLTTTDAAAREHYSAMALAQGVRWLLIDADSPLPAVADSAAVTTVRVTALAQRVGRIASRFYGDPSARQRLMGVTGTNGKSSVSHYIATALAIGGEAVGLMGTLGAGLIGSALQPTGYTTPDPLQLQQQLSTLAAAGAVDVVLEVSSHALDQGRLDGTQIETAVFTNLSHDHLDYHHTLAAYAAAKRRLFEWPELRNAVLNRDDATAAAWLPTLPATLNWLDYSLLQPAALQGRDLRLDRDGLSLQLHYRGAQAPLRSSLLGRFNASNLLAAAGVLLLRGMALSTVAERLAQVPPVAGRMERFGGGAAPRVVVDYAHTPDALAEALQALRGHTSGRLICLFGCGGDRDQHKRPLMGAIAERFADHLILTDDNPRHESGDAIIAAIQRGMTQPQRAVVERDRAAAIATAVATAGGDDLILIAGKGHEQWQQVGDTLRPHSDREQVEALVGLAIQERIA